MFKQYIHIGSITHVFMLVLYEKNVLHHPSLAYLHY